MTYRRYSSNAALRQSSEPVAVQAVLKSALSKFGIDKEIARYHFVLHWKEIVGEQLSKVTQPECIKNKALVVRVTDSVWAQELSFQKKVILMRLKRFMGHGETVDDVLFYVAGKMQR